MSEIRQIPEVIYKKNHIKRKMSLPSEIVVKKHTDEVRFFGIQCYAVIFLITYSFKQRRQIKD